MGEQARLGVTHPGTAAGGARGGTGTRRRGGRAGGRAVAATHRPVAGVRRTTVLRTTVLGTGVLGAGRRPRTARRRRRHSVARGRDAAGATGRVRVLTTWPARTTALARPLRALGALRTTGLRALGRRGTSWRFVTARPGRAAALARPLGTTGFVRLLTRPGAIAVVVHE
ncbi:hypothetical protein GCM10017786_51080 [Amycolatopsis deserti]|uniref:Uncharacterized protein n=1 Tax=Amycolatopsis deserti TaxID=185696 RepID=A0ABQ3JAC8_9PSEU|nr:hypothetical protein GCM10017786_51080 [Amycolatopsis deserti]